MSRPTQTSTDDSFLASVRFHLTMATVLGWARIGLTAAMMLLIGRVVDDVLGGTGQLGGYGWLLLAFVTARALVAAVQPVIAADAVGVGSASARRRVVSHLFRIGPAFRTSERTGDVVAKATEGIDAVGLFVGRFVPQLIQGVTVPLLLGIVILTIDVPTGLVLIGILPVGPLLFRLIEGRFTAVSRAMREASDRLSAQFLDSLQGIATLKAFDRAEDHGDELAAEGEQLRRRTMELLAVNQMVLIIVDWVFALVTVTAASAVALTRFNSGHLSFGEAVAVVLLGALLVEPLTLIGRFFYVGAIGRAAQRQIRALLALPTTDEGDTAPRADGVVTLDRVSFSYSGTDQLALDSVSFSVESGETVALIGASGAGKTTIANLLMGFYRPGDGRILFDGESLSDMAADWIRAQVSLVGQGTYLFYGSVADNLRMAKPDATMEELEEAARAARIHSTIAAMADGYDTVVGERGATLSGGEAQRLSLARALLKDSPIVILDEPTSQIDAAAARAIRDALAHELADRTVIVIAHRFSTLSNVDRVIVLDSGTVVEQGGPAILDSWQDRQAMRLEDAGRLT